MIRRGLLLLLLCSAQLCGCKDDGEKLESAEFGVFYGGQIQERDEIPFVIDSSKQQQGFRLTLKHPEREPLDIRWELSRPGSVPRGQLLARPEDRVTELGQATLKAGERVFEKRFPFTAGDPLGLWNIRVTAGTHLAIDRPFTVYDPSQRRRSKRSTQNPDAGR